MTDKSRADNSLIQRKKLNKSALKNENVVTNVCGTLVSIGNTAQGAFNIAFLVQK